MEVKVISGRNYDGYETLSIEVDGRSVANVYPLYECPEDALLERDLSFAYDIPELMHAAYEAGRRGEPFNIIEVDESEAN